MSIVNKNLGIFFLVILISFLVFCEDLIAAEVLQVSSSSQLIIGDNNRNYTVKIACLDVIPEKENDAINFIKSQLPRSSRVNLRPKGSKDGMLIAKIFPLESDVDIAQKLIDEDLANSTC